MFEITGNSTYKTVATAATAWLLKFRAASGANIYRFDGKPAHGPYSGDDILTETTTCEFTGNLSLLVVLSEPKKALY